MRIKLAILDQDSNYLNRISSVFTNKFADKLEVYSFTDKSVAIESLKSSRTNVFIASDTFDIDTTQLPKHCGFAYLVESANIETFKEKPAICKYQKVEMIYRTILEIYADNVDDSIGLKLNSDSNARIITFVSASGGVGSSSVAAACARSFAGAGRKTLYLNLEQFGNAESFFQGAGQTDLGDVIFALKSKKTNLSFKLESNVRRDSSGVYFFSSPQSALHMSELKSDEIQKLLVDLSLAGSYEIIVLDIDFSLSASTMEIFRQSSSIVFVSDGSEIANLKFSRAYSALEIMDDKADKPLLPRIAIFYNKFSRKSGRKLAEGVHEIGGAPKYEDATTTQIVSQLAGMGVFLKI